jgi:hypothetical protein
LDCFLEGNAADFSAPGDMLRTVLGHEAGQGADGGQALIARGTRALALLLDVLQEGAHALRADLLHGQSIKGLMALPGDERQQEPQRIAVAQLRLTRKITFNDEVLKEEAADPGTQQSGVIHDPPPAGRSVQSDD